MIQVVFAALMVDMAWYIICGVLALAWKMGSMALIHGGLSSSR